MSSQAPPYRIALIGCHVLEAEIAAFTRDATHIIRREYFQMGLPDQPTALRTQLAGARTKILNKSTGVQAACGGLCYTAILKPRP